MSEEIDSAMRVAEAAARERIAVLLEGRATELAARGDGRCAHVLREVHAQLKGNAFIPLEVRDAMAAKHAPSDPTARVVAAARAVNDGTWPPRVAAVAELSAALAALDARDGATAAPRRNPLCVYRDCVHPYDHDGDHEYPDGKREPNRCHAGRDGECNWKHCPQEANNRANRQPHCPLDVRDEDDE